MKTFLVGGFVRDMLLGLNPKDLDFVVVGSTPEQMLNLGFEQVGQDFPVFLHPLTKDEHALARKESSTGDGFSDFTTEWKDVTLEEDVLRRDLTINSLAQDEDGKVLDFVGGLKDLEDKVLRHTSDAFKEDPVRVLRLARFAARFPEFNVHHSTMEMMTDMVNSGMLNALVAERVFQELEKTLTEDNAHRFFEVLDECGALEVLFPEIHALKDQTQPPQWHPEGDAFVHTMLVLREACKHSDDVLVRFAALSHDFGKGLTLTENLPSHHRHEQAGVPVVEKFCDRLKAPTSWKLLGMMTSREHLNVHRFNELNPKTLVKFFARCDAFRNPKRFRNMLVASVCDANGRGPTVPKVPMSKVQNVMDCLSVVNAVDARSFVEQGFKGEQVGRKVHQQRVVNAKNWKSENS